MYSDPDLRLPNVFTLRSLLALLPVVLLSSLASACVQPAHDSISMLEQARVWLAREIGDSTLSFSGPGIWTFKKTHALDWQGDAFEPAIGAGAKLAHVNQMLANKRIPLRLGAKRKTSWRMLACCGGNHFLHGETSAAGADFFANFQGDRAATRIRVRVGSYVSTANACLVAFAEPVTDASGAGMAGLTPLASYCTTIDGVGATEFDLSVNIPSSRPARSFIVEVDQPAMAINQLEFDAGSFVRHEVVDCSGGKCLRRIGGGGDIFLGRGSAGATLLHLRELGQLSGGPASEIAVVLSLADEHERLVIVRDGESVAARMDSELPCRSHQNICLRFSGFIQGDVVYPFMTSVPVLSEAERFALGIWPRSHVCVYTGVDSPGRFQTALSGAMRCPPSFQTWEAGASAGSSRHWNWLLFDVDADGWEDLHLLFYGKGEMVTFSGRTGQELNRLPIVMRSLNPAFSGVLDSDRVYGTQYMYFKEGRQKVLFMGGYPVGGFSDEGAVTMCNVTRYVAMADAPAGDAGGWRLLRGTDPAPRRWQSSYYGFYQHSYDLEIEPIQCDPNGSVQNCTVGRMLDECIHRTSSSLTRQGGRPVSVAYSVFSAFPYMPAGASNLCWEEQLAYSRDAAYFLDFIKCLPKLQPTPGAWRVEVRDEADGMVVINRADSYLWAIVDGMLPDNRSVLFIEDIAPGLPFNRANHTSGGVRAFTLRETGGVWSLQSAGSMPAGIQGIPVLGDMIASSALNTTRQRLVDAIKEDRDGDGLLDARIYTTTMWDGDANEVSAVPVWIGFNPGTGQFEIKP